jgi:hypothetical protein
MAAFGIATLDVPSLRRRKLAKITGNKNSLETFNET